MQETVGHLRAANDPALKDRQIRRWIIPAILFYIAMVGFYPEITQKAVPVNFMLGELNVPALKILFQLVLFGTFIETGLGLIHSVNERIADGFTERKDQMPRWVRPLVAIGMLAFSIFLAAELGIISLVAKGYGTLTYVILAIYALPILTIGIWRIYNWSPVPDEKEAAS